MKEIKPQKGFQEMFLSSEADIVIGGSAAGVGKTFALLLDFLYNVDNSDFGGVIFRRTSPQIRNEGGLWDTSLSLYSLAHAIPRETDLTWKFSSGAKIKFSHLEYEKNVIDWQGSQIPFIGFDELTHFTEKMFTYLCSRNRSGCGVKPRIRATCNPDPDSWVAKFIAWWIDEDTGFPIREREGVLRYYMRDSGEYVWGDTKQEVLEKTKHIWQPILASDPDIILENLVKSVTFIAGSIYDNKELLSVNPEYLSNLLAQDEDTKNQLLNGNWKRGINANDIIEYTNLLNSFTNEYVETGKKYITADIALKGSDLFVVGVWDGLRLIDISIMEKSNGKQVIETINTLAKTYQVPNSQIIFDNDGVGGFVDGFIPNAKEFKNGSRPLMKKNYENLKTQCYYKLGEIVNDNKLFISEKVQNTVVGKRKIRDIIIDERRAIKRDKADFDGKLRIISKDQMKNIIGHSPDIMDMVMMRMYFEIRPPQVIAG